MKKDRYIQHVKDALNRNASEMPLRDYVEALEAIRDEVEEMIECGEADLDAAGEHD